MRANVSGDEFLAGIFAGTEGSVVIAKPTKDKGYFQRSWRGGDAATLAPGAWYWCCSTSKAAAKVDRDGVTTINRRKSDLARTCALVLDDIGTKVETVRVEQMLPPPSAIVETSPGNFQWVYILDGGAEPQEAATALERLAAADVTDAGAKDASHVFRLPGSINDKVAVLERNGGQPWSARVTLWEPERRYTLDEIVARVPQSADPKAKRKADANADGQHYKPNGDHGLDILQRFNMVLGQGSDGGVAVQSALNVIEAKAHFDGPVRPAHVRIGGLDDKLYLDLGDDAWQAAEIDARGWRVVGRPPVRFRRAAGMQPLPVPQRNGSITRLRSFLNVASDTDFVLAVSWLLAGLRDRGPYPVLVLSGEQGSAKSTFAAILRALLDPNTAPLRALPREDRDLFIAANNGHVLAFDNVSGLPAWISDTLCRLATGGGFAARQLYTDQDEMLFDACRPVSLNGIEDMVTRPDLADRQLFLTLEPIPEDKRRPEAALWSEFEADRPSILGSLLDAVAEGLKRLPDTRLPKLPRMADFALWATACEVTPWADGTTFWSAYSGNMAGSVEAVIDADPIADSLRTMMTAQSEWEGTSKQLLSALAGIAGDLINKTKSWPATPEALRGRLRRAATGLRKIGIDIVFPDKHARPRNIKITSTISAAYRPENTGVQPSKLSDLSETKRKSSDDKGLAQPEQPTVSDSRSTASSTVGPTDGTKPLKSNGYDGPDSPDSNKAIRSASDEPTWRGKV